MTLAANRCQVGARFELRGIPNEAHETTYAAAPGSAAGRIRPDPDAVASYVPPPHVSLDAESRAAMDAARAEHLPIVIEGDGVGLAPSIALRLEHDGAPLGWISEVSREGNAFIVRGEAAGEWYAQLSARTAVSPNISVREARIVHLPGLRYVRVTRSQLDEVSATAAPHLQGTMFMVGRPGSNWLGVRYPTGPEPFTHDADTLRLHTDDAEARWQATQRERAAGSGQTP